ncbi:MAG: ABC transporter permease [Acidobacteriota bacterium]|jgi:putative ABC transport system permease protein|nr:ABC transporter permease [Acidobacteriota bacterium]
MNFTETLKLALAAIWAHTLRSFLTLLGMIIGVTAFMVVLSILQGFNNYVDEKIAGIGSNSFAINRFSFEDFRDSDALAEAQRRNKDLTFEELEFVRKNGDLIKKIGAKTRGNRMQVKRGSEILEDVSVDGVEPIIADIDKVEIEKGRYFVKEENNSAARVAFIGADIESNLFPGGSALGGKIKINGLPYRVVGVAVAKGSVFGQPQDSFIHIPIRTYLKSKNRWSSLYFVGTSYSDETFDDAVEQARTLMRIKRKVPFGDKDNFGIFTPDAITNLRDQVLGPIFIVIIAVPTIALLVGAIVIMNIMLVAVTERTKEIGIRKSLGAKQADILKQFLAESATLAAIGGTIGLILAEVIGIIISMYVFQTSIPWWAVILAIGVSAAVGMLAGLFPAWKAARLDPIEALRSD